VIGFLRFAGILNAAVWLGAAVFFAAAARPAASSAKMKTLLGPVNFPYFSEAIARMLAARLCYVELTCGIAALGLVACEWLYFGKTIPRLWRGLLIVLLGMVLAGWGLQPKLEQWQQVLYGPNTRLPQRQEASHLFNAWQRAFEWANLLMVAGVAAYLWRVANPPDPTRFVSRTKFRS